MPRNPYRIPTSVRPIYRFHQNCDQGHLRPLLLQSCSHSNPEAALTISHLIPQDRHHRAVLQRQRPLKSSYPLVHYHPRVRQHVKNETSERRGCIHLSSQLPFLCVDFSTVQSTTSSLLDNVCCLPIFVHKTFHTYSPHVSEHASRPAYGSHKNHHHHYHHHHQHHHHHHEKISLTSCNIHQVSCQNGSGVIHSFVPKIRYSAIVL